MPPGRTSRMLISARRMARPITAVARSLLPSALNVPAAPSSRRIGPFSTISTAQPPVEDGGAVQQELRLQHGGEGGQHGRKMHRQAAGHDGVDRQLLRGDRHAAHRLDAEQAGRAGSSPSRGRRARRPRWAGRSAGRRSSRWRGRVPGPHGCRRHRRSSRRAAWAWVSRGGRGGTGVYARGWLAATPGLGRERQPGRRVGDGTIARGLRKRCGSCGDGLPCTVAPRFLAPLRRASLRRCTARPCAIASRSLALLRRAFLAP